MIRYHPMARVTPLLGGNVRVYDLTEIPSLVRTLPAYPPVVRDLENLDFDIRRRRYGVRPMAGLSFEIAHSASQNTRARWYEPAGELLVATNEFDNGGAAAPPWQQFNSIIITPDVVTGPGGLLNADKIEDANAAAIAFMKQRPAGITPTPAPKTFLMGLYVRSDSSQNFSFGVSNDTSQSNNVTFTATPSWRRFFARMTFNDGAGSSVNGYIYPAGVSGPNSAVGYIYAAEATMRQIVELPGTDEEILRDLIKHCQEPDYQVELSLDGGLTYRVVELEGDPFRGFLKDKAVGQRLDFDFTGTKIIPSAPATLDGSQW